MAALTFASCGSSSSPTLDQTSTLPATSEAGIPVAEDATGATMDSASENGAVAADGETELAGVTVVAVGEVSHTADKVDYPTSPPAGGSHNPGWQNCGFYTVDVPNEQAVHSLEHGAVWVAYSPDVPADELGELEVMATGETHLLVTPYPDLAAPYVLTAWGRQAPIDSIRDPLFKEFLDTYMSQGPTTPEPGAPCSDAFGIPPTDPLTIG